MGELIERSEETAAVDDALSAAAAGSGGSMLVVGQAGIGKSALLGYARHAATAAGFTVLHAVSTPVSTMLSHAVARDWLAPLARRSRPGTRPFDGPAAALAESLTSPATQAGAPTTSWSLAKVDYALRWALEGLAEARPLLLVVDDVHWTDTGSLQLLDLLSARLDARVARLPALLLLAQRTGEPLPSADLVDRLAGRARVLSPRPLSVLGVDRVRRQREPVPAIARLSAQELHRRSGGVPFLLEELLRAPSLEEAPREVVSSVRERLARLGPAATAVARTTAALGDEASFDAVAELTAMSVAELADPLELLADAGIVDLGMWRSRPTHPLVAEAILGSLTPSERSALFSSTADYLASCGRSRHVVASHLLHTLPGEDASVVSLLWDAGAEALAAGNPAAAATYLLRAVGETRPEDTAPELLGLAASAHLAAGLHEEAFDLWERAGRRTSDPVARARLLADVGDARMTAGDRTEAAACHTEAVAVLRAAGHDLSSPAMREALTRTGLPRLFYDGVVGAETLEAAAEARARPREADTPLDRRLFALEGADLVVRSGDRGQAVALALRALGEGALLEEETSEGMGFYLASAVLYWSDAYAEDLVFLDAAVDDARRRGSVLGFATASYTRGMVYERQGRLHAAATEYQAALDLREQGWADFADAAVAGAARVNLALGRRDEALTLEPALRRGAARGRFIGAPTAIVAGMIRASQGDHEQALEDYRRAGRLLGEHRDNGSIAEWRELSACSLHALGLHEEALATAEEAVRHARVWGAPRALGVALLALAEVTLGGAEPAVLREAVATLETAGSLDLLARARLQLAARLTSEASTREEAFALMTEALDYGRGHAVPPVTGQATTMLLRAGQPVEDGDVQPVARLTPGERRVAELAAAGDTNRQIAEKLFVTVKAVEWHLSNTYRKLEISSRSELAVSLYGDPGPSSSSLR